MKIVPSSRPAATRTEVEHMIEKAGIKWDEIKFPVAVVGVRGYYRDTMGKPGQNDRGIYDDAIFILTPAVFMSFNANTDPGHFSPGIATLKPGMWFYKVGIHGLSKPPERRYTALVQAADVTVSRDGAHDDTGFFGINIHHGGEESVSSLGCQTIFPEEWAQFISTIQIQLGRYAQHIVPYILVTEG